MRKVTFPQFRLLVEGFVWDFARVNLHGVALFPGGHFSKVSCSLPFVVHWQNFKMSLPSTGGTRRPTNAKTSHSDAETLMTKVKVRIRRSTHDVCRKTRADTATFYPKHPPFLLCFSAHSTKPTRLRWRPKPRAQCKWSLNVCLCKIAELPAATKLAYSC